jgi:hypothetical protein
MRPGRPDHDKAEVFGEPPGLEIVEDHPLGLCLERQADGLSLASIERGVRHPAVQGRCSVCVWIQGGSVGVLGATSLWTAGGITTSA